MNYHPPVSRRARAFGVGIRAVGPDRTANAIAPDRSGRTSVSRSRMSVATSLEVTDAEGGFESAASCFVARAAVQDLCVAPEAALTSAHVLSRPSRGSGRARGPGADRPAKEMVSHDVFPDSELRRARTAAHPDGPSCATSPGGGSCQCSAGRCRRTGLLPRGRQPGEDSPDEGDGVGLVVSETVEKGRHPVARNLQLLVCEMHGVHASSVERRRPAVAGSPAPAFGASFRRDWSSRHTGTGLHEPLGWPV